MAAAGIRSCWFWRWWWWRELYDADLDDVDSNDDLSDTESVDALVEKHSDSDDEERSENYKQEVAEILQLRQWVQECNIAHSHVDKLIAILRPRLLTCLPKTCKTLMGTFSAQYNIEPMCDSDGSIGEFVYSVSRKD